MGPTDTVTIWQISTALVNVQPWMYALLNLQEQQRLQRFCRKSHARAYLLRHVAEHLILQNTLGTESTLTVTPLGQPHVAGISLSCAHTENESALALCKGMPLGLDLEERHFSLTYEQARFFLHAREQALLYGCTDEQSTELLRSLWVRKEAIVKALGLGLRMDPRTICIDPSTNSAVDGLGKKWFVPVFVKETLLFAVALPMGAAKTCFLWQRFDWERLGIPVMSQSC